MNRQKVVIAEHLEESLSEAMHYKMLSVSSLAQQIPTKHWNR